jgi:hypothetical protein
LCGSAWFTTERKGAGRAQEQARLQAAYEQAEKSAGMARGARMRGKLVEDEGHYAVSSDGRPYLTSR